MNYPVSVRCMQNRLADDWSMKWQNLWIGVLTCTLYPDQADCSSSHDLGTCSWKLCISLVFALSGFFHQLALLQQISCIIDKCRYACALPSCSPTSFSVAMNSPLDFCHLIRIHKAVSPCKCQMKRIQNAVSPDNCDKDAALYWVFNVHAEELGSLTRCMASSASVI